MSAVLEEAMSDPPSRTLQSPLRGRSDTGGCPIEIDLAALDTVEPKPPEFIVDSWLPAGEPVLFAGHGGTGKSSLALHLAVCIALGRPWHGIRTHQRRVAYYSFEDGECALLWRLAQISRHLDVEIAALKRRLWLYDGTRHDAILFGDSTTDSYERMLAQVKQSGAQVVIIDGVSDTFAGNENSRAAVKAYVRAIRNLLPADGSGAALLIAHVDKTTARKPPGSRGSPQGYSGSTAWHNGVRARWELRPDFVDDQRLILELAKANYCFAGTLIGLRWSDERGLHVRESIAAPAAGSAVMPEVRAQLLRIFKAAEDAGQPITAARSGSRTTIHALNENPALPKALAGDRNKRALRSLIADLRRDGSLYEGEETSAKDRHKRPVLKVSAGVLDDCGNSKNSRIPGDIPHPAGVLSGGYGGNTRTPAPSQDAANSDRQDQAGTAARGERCELNEPLNAEAQPICAQQDGAMPLTMPPSRFAALAAIASQRTQRAEGCAA